MVAYAKRSRMAARRYVARKRPRYSGYRSYGAWGSVIRNLPRAYRFGKAAYNVYNRARKARVVKTVEALKESRRQPNVAKYRTRGSLYKRFRARHKTTRDVSSMAGAQLKTENRGVISSAECVYIGHSAFADEVVLRVVVMALVRKLFKLARNDIVSWSDDQGYDGAFSEGTLTLEWQNYPENTTQTNTFTITAGMSPISLVDTLITNMYTWFSAARDVQLRRLIYEASRTGSFVIGPPHTLDLEQCVLCINVNSKLAIQNRTLASSAVGADETNRNDVANNPLTGKIYRGAGTNGFQFKYRNDTTDQETLLPDADGVISSVPSDMSAEQQLMYKRPPNGRDIVGCQKDSGVFLNPGNIRSSVVFWKCNIGVNKFFSKLTRRFNLGSGAKKVKYNMGVTEVLGLQKRCDTGVDEPNISAGYEMESMYKCYVKTKSSTVPAYVQKN